ncbi:MAG: hypothetical protein ISS15_14475 [Alphaproteobacteria bacterium]|nr:hypothetical protein [Alphaproteobacteria bacterium]MBL6937523.1 hypothetical protein [Alphaproteobacteria bacterium]MBL7098861.1 hypothetical protein [Alphaproteobacteria bacterium]
MTLHPTYVFRGTQSSEPAVKDALTPPPHLFGHCAEPDHSPLARETFLHRTMRARRAGFVFARNIGKLEDRLGEIFFVRFARHG